ncbi:MAG: MarR family transcriptional regulator [Pigmentiphaga sp.]|nr:MarR family transcriptional regulator [Pigmentiphaga sp.]
MRTSYLLYHAWFAMRNRVDEALKPYGLTSMQYTLLSTLAARKNLSSAQLSRRFYITPQAMGQVLNQLEAAGWLTRTPDPENHRVLQVNLTKAGRERVSMCDAEMNLIEDKAFARIDRSTLAAMRTGLESMMVSMRGERG